MRLELATAALLTCGVALAQSPQPVAPPQPPPRLLMSDPGAAQGTSLTQRSRIRAFSASPDGMVQSLYLSNGSVVELPAGFGPNFNQQIRKGRSIRVEGQRTSINGQTILTAQHVRIGREEFAAQPGSRPGDRAGAPPPPPPAGRGAPRPPQGGPNDGPEVARGNPRPGPLGAGRPGPRPLGPGPAAAGPGAGPGASREDRPGTPGAVPPPPPPPSPGEHARRDAPPPPPANSAVPPPPPAGGAAPPPPPNGPAQQPPPSVEGAPRTPLPAPQDNSAPMPAPPAVSPAL